MSVSHQTITRRARDSCIVYNALLRMLSPLALPRSCVSQKRMRRAAAHLIKPSCPAWTYACSFNFDYLLLWGAKYAPLMAHEGWRWLSPLLLHQHANHLLNNVLLFIEFSWPLERLYGPVRLLLLFVLSGLGATFSSVLWEPPCQVRQSKGAVPTIWNVYS